MNESLQAAPVSNAGVVYATAKKMGAVDPTGKPGFLLAFLTELYRLAPLAGLSPDWLAAQSSHECDVWRSPIWKARGNPAGIGVTDGTDHGYAFRTGAEAAQAQIVHMAGYVFGDAFDGQVPLVLMSFVHLDPRWAALMASGMTGTVLTIADLGNGRWASDPKYAAGLRRHFNLFITPPPQEEPPVTDRDISKLRFAQSLVPLPKHSYQLATRKKNGTGMNLLGKRTFRGIVFHRALSGNQTFQNAIDWLLNPVSKGLTDGFIDHRTGAMVFINPMMAVHAKNVFPAGWQDRAGWAQGPYNAAGASADGRAFKDRYGAQRGADIINMDLESMEITGNYETAISEACKTTLVQWTASRAQMLKVPWWSFPIIPSTGLTMIYGHREFCGLSHKVCPGAVVWAFINGELITRVRDVLKAAQTSGKPVEVPTTPVYVEPQVPAWFSQLTGEEPSYREKRSDGTEIVYFPTETNYVATEAAPAFLYADGASKQVDEPTPTDQDVNAAFVFDWQGEEWLIRSDGARQRLRHFRRVSGKAAAA